MYDYKKNIKKLSGKFSHDKTNTLQVVRVLSLWIADFNISIYRKERWVYYKGCVNLTSLYSVKTSITKTITNSFEILRKL